MSDIDHNKYEFRKKINNLVFSSTLNTTAIFESDLKVDRNPMIFCGNHLNELDQFAVIKSSDVMIHWITNKEYFKRTLKISHQTLMPRYYKLMKCIPNDEHSNVVALDYLKNGSSIGIFPEGKTNTLTYDKVEELYSELKSGLSLKEYELLLKSTKVKLSQINLLQQLYFDRKISDDDYQRGLLCTDYFLYNCAEKGIITKEEYDDSLLLSFDNSVISIAKESGALIVPFAIAVQGSTNIKINFGKLLDVEKLSEEDSNMVVREHVLSLLKKNENRN